MEGEGMTVTRPVTPTETAPAAISPPSDSDSPLVEPLDASAGQVEPPPSDDTSCSSEKPSLPDDLRDKIIKQVEYYFSDENLPTDKYLLSFVKKDKQGYVPIAVIASFRKMKKLVQDSSLIVMALRDSSLLGVSASGKKVRRLLPLPSAEVKDSKLCTVLVENLPEDHSKENIWKIFTKVGHIKDIWIHDPVAVEESKKGGKVKLISNKVHALVEYDAVEAAEKAVATLNDEQDWRNGMRVKPLKQIGAYGARKKGWKDHDSDKGSGSQVSDPAGHNPIEEALDEGEQLKVKNEIKDQGRGRSRKEKYRGMNGHGHGSNSLSHSATESKRPPRPRMPDGTRGFAMGRGRPLVSNQS